MVEKLIGIRKLIFGMFCQLTIVVAVMADKITGDVFRDLTIAIVGAVVAGNVIGKFKNEGKPNG